MSALDRIFAAADLTVPEALDGWDAELQAGIDRYSDRAGAVQLVDIVIGAAAFVFDCVAERVVFAFAVSTEPLFRRDGARMRGFPDVNVGAQRLLGVGCKRYDRGHFLGHASGGELDVNLFPHERSLNRGWSAEGKRFRRLERMAAEQAGRFFFHRPMYVDESWLPGTLEYGVLVGRAWARDEFSNR